jgi:hypothetical protein
MTWLLSTAAADAFQKVKASKREGPESGAFFFCRVAENEAFLAFLPERLEFGPAVTLVERVADDAEVVRGILETMLAALRHIV